MELDYYRRVYESLVQIAMRARSGDVSVLLEAIEMAAKVAVGFFPGLLSDYRLEELLLEVGRSHLPAPITCKASENCRRILHVATELYGTGGHTRVLLAWMSLDASSESFVYLTQQKELLSQSMSEKFKASGAKIVRSEVTCPLAGAAALRKEVDRLRPDLVVLHHHPFDMVPILAFANPGGPPVICYNHADHLFGLGPSISDLYIDFRQCSQGYSLNNRGARKSCLLPYPLLNDDAPSACASKQIAKQAIGIESNEIVLLTMGSPYKFARTEEVDFAGEYAEFLRTRTNVHLFVIGLSEKEGLSALSEEKPDNLHFLGLVENPEKWTAAADYFVEPMPMGSGLACFDVVRRGAFPIFGYVCADLTGLGTSAMFPSLMPDCETHSKAEYFALLDREIQTRELSTKFEEQVRKAVQECLTPQWESRLEDIYCKLIGQEHQVGMPSELRAIHDTKAERFAEFCSLSEDPVNYMMHLRSVASDNERRSLIQKYETSLSLKIGRKLTWLPAKIRQFVEKRH